MTNNKKIKFKRFLEATCTASGYSAAVSPSQNDFFSPPQFISIKAPDMRKQ